MNIENNEFSLEKSLARIEEITRVLDAGNASLEESLKLYEEGIILVRKCSVLLSDVERKITELKAAGGGVAASPFEFKEE